MNFDQQLRDAFDSLSGRVREEVARQVQAVRDELASTAAAERTAAVAQAVADARAEGERRLEEARAEAERRLEEARADADRLVIEARREAEEKSRADAQRAAEQAREEAEREAAFARAEAERAVESRLQTLVAEAQTAARETALNAAGQRLLDGVRAIDRGRSLSEILDTLAGCAAREAERAGVLVVDREEIRGWRFVGFGPGLDEGTEIRCALPDAGLVGEAVRTRATAAANSSGASSMPPFAHLPPGREMLAVPLPVSGHIVAVLYADRGSADSAASDGSPAWPASIEVLARHAARCLETITAFRAAQALTPRPQLLEHRS